MEDKEIKDMVLSFLKNDAFLALGTLCMAFAVNVFSIGEYLIAILLLLLSGMAFTVRTFRKMDVQIKKAGGVKSTKKYIEKKF